MNVLKATASIMLCTLSISAWKARKFDGKITEEVYKTHQIEDAGRYNKRLLLRSAESYSRVCSIEGEMRRYWETHTLEYDQKSVRILPTSIFMKYTAEMRRLEEKFWMAIDEFIADYPNLKAAARESKTLGPVYREDDYPTSDVLRTKFGVRQFIRPFPNSHALGVDLPEHELAKLKAALDKDAEESIRNANRDIVGRLYEAVSTLATTLYLNESPRLDVANKVKTLCELLPQLNFSDDPVLNQILEEAQLHLGDLSGAVLKESAYARSDAASKASRLEGMMAAFMGAAPVTTAATPLTVSSPQLRLVA